MTDAYDVTIRVGGKEELKKTLAQFEGEIVRVNVKSNQADQKVFDTSNKAEKAWQRMQQKFSDLIHLQQQMDKVRADGDLTIAQMQLKLQMLKMQAIHTIQSISGMITSAWAFFKQSAEMIGGGVDAMLDALVGFGISAVSSLLTIATGMMGNPYTLILGVIALSSAIMTLIKTLQSQQEMRQKKAEMDAKLAQQLARGNQIATVRIHVSL